MKSVKRVLASFLIFTMVLSLSAVMVVFADETDASETQTTEERVLKGTVKTSANSGGFTDVGYNTDKFFDGDLSTFGVVGSYAVGGSGNPAGQVFAIIDLGAEYELTDISFRVPTDTQVGSVIQNLNNYTEGTTEFDSTRWNYGLKFYASSTEPATNGTPTGTALDFQYGSPKTQTITYKITDATKTSIKDNKYRYVTVWAQYGSLLAFSEMTIKGKVTPSATVLDPNESYIKTEVDGISVNSVYAGNSLVTASAYDGTTVSDAMYNSSLLRDKNAETFVFARSLTSTGLCNNANMVVVDLGDYYEITDLSFSTPATDTVNGMVEKLTNYTESNTDSKKSFNMPVQVFATSVAPTMANMSDGSCSVENAYKFEFTTDTSTGAVNPGTSHKWEATSDGEFTDGKMPRAYRYLAFYSPYTSGIAVGEIAVKYYKQVETVTVNKEILNGKTGVAYSNTTLMTSTDFYDGYGLDKITDGKSATFGIVKAKEHSNNGHLLYYDLGEELNITKIKFDMTERATAQNVATVLSTINFNAGTYFFVSSDEPARSDFDGSNITDSGDAKNINRLQNENYNDRNGVIDTFENVGKYRYVGIWMPYSYGIAVNEIEVWADVKEEVKDDTNEPIAMHFTEENSVDGDEVSTFGSNDLYYAGRFVNDTDNDNKYIVLAASYSDGNLKDVKVENVTVPSEDYKDVRMQIWSKINVDTIKGFVWDESFAPVTQSTVISAASGNYDPLFDGSILSMTPTVYDAETLIDGYNETAEESAKLPKTGLSEYSNVRTIFYDGIQYKGETKKAFAYVAIPEGASAENPVPGIVLVHGGGGAAYDIWAKQWADRGYAAISIDTEGRMTTESGTYDGYNNRTFTTFGHQNNLSYTDFTADYSKHSDMWMYQAASDAVLAGNVLRSLPEVDSSKIGITGISYGSLIAMTAIGADNRFSFAVPVYGCGHLWEGNTYFKNKLNESRISWDPSRFYMQSGDVPVMWVVTNRETNFALDSISSSYTDIYNKANLCIVDNMAHSEKQGSIVGMEETYATTKEQIAKVQNTMFTFVDNAFGKNQAKSLAKLSKLGLDSGVASATVTLPDGVSSEGATAKLKYIKVENYDDCFYNKDENTTYWRLGKNGIVSDAFDTENPVSSYDSPWCEADATVSGTTISVSVPTDATYGYIEYVDSENRQITTEMVKFK